MAGNLIRSITGTSRSNTLTGDAPPKALPLRENLYPQNQQWRENLISKNQNVNNSPGAEETFWVSKTTDAKVIEPSAAERTF